MIIQRGIIDADQIYKDDDIQPANGAAKDVKSDDKK